jgi:NADPH-dependent glutamate synthase beta subunit-like oxidoreductase
MMKNLTLTHQHKNYTETLNVDCFVALPKFSHRNPFILLSCKNVHINEDDEDVGGHITTNTTNFELNLDEIDQLISVLTELKKNKFK